MLSGTPREISKESVPLLKRTDAKFDWKGRSLRAIIFPANFPERKSAQTQLTPKVTRIEMGSFEVNLDVLPFIQEQFLSWIGRDPESRELMAQLRTHIKVANKEAAFVQMVGMYEPVPIRETFVSVPLLIRAETVTVERLISSSQDAIVTSEAGCGKTTLLHWIYVKMLDDPASPVPLLYTLRRPGALKALSQLIDCLELEKKASKQFKKSGIALLVDGYDEISQTERKEVSELLMRFSVCESGNFFLTCRSWYEIYELKAPRYRIQPFSHEQAYQFILNFSKIYRVGVNPGKLLTELNERGFSSFIGHPLLLTLVCLLKDRANTALPTNSIGLLKRALETLAFRWDLAKGIERSSRSNIDGSERIACLMRVAYAQRHPHYSEQTLFSIVRQHLEFLHRRDVDIRIFLYELAQFYGLLVPVEDSGWSFVHRTIHDYLAARFWVETGNFVRARYGEWDMREAYAACLNPDSATAFLEQALIECPNMIAFHECLLNETKFDPVRVAKALIHHYREFPEQLKITHNADLLRVDFAEAWPLYAPVDLLQESLRQSCEEESLAAEGVLASTFVELGVRRQAKIEPSILKVIKNRFAKRPIFQINHEGPVRTAGLDELIALCGGTNEDKKIVS